MSDIAEFVIRRILVALDVSALSLAALEEAAAFAAAMEAELTGLFVEDINLVRSAGLPFARQVSYPSGAEERLSSERIDREFKARAELARKALAAAAERRHMPWSFRTVRGHVTNEILAAAAQADLIFIGKSGWSPARPLGSTALALIAAAPGAFLLVQQEIPQAGPIMVLFDGSEGSRRALEAAVRLAIAREVGLVVVIAGASPDLYETLQEGAKQIIGGRLKGVRLRRVPAAGPGDVAHIVRTEGVGLVVLPGDSLLAQEPGIRRLLELIRNPFLLIR
jgi:nucleotide-binding universal stress UspA family protein